MKGEMGTNLYISFFFSLVGMGYFMYGKKQSNVIILLTGIALMFYPYLVSSVAVMLSVGAILTVLPFVIGKVLDL
ncbi:MAG: hypothetical protein IEMM0002_0858 [bacterium]|nr:MAG: hypothetical protein IEMM0002_0858 [bacterium]